ncbi:MULTISPECIES: phosphopantothenoylcysteine decarboxylase [unclassified Variovorax]|uniref:phosphopantothenoylcysteine decarboxylase n=1 Tax=unclassified Variovorax TaxID=663243 RepID=UPI0008389631|nr:MULTISPECIES: phosphopantothenoylcysteine decarboxylase [unclassified Variovorax]PNG50174.1 hypothetical protein CHC06_05797 [Variovorax sp. B2]PNG51047.1 hypothetical protein CHC07_05703 [Variovorax sp. B4]VTU42208.1 bifunctional phosphopantothenoylcysteine decarboxylase/phosphopantothenate synthase [Variovorax sp. SRS16]VTU42240.1 bifunctional phosphopantothenoylcysteine decarboxylase/phosphopantothenate synthase [Variovorax sp. PBL-E5]VTU44288.1 bifunctional phosphopantothenoylcysteine d
MTIHIFGGGTIMHVRSHMALCAPAKGGTARKLAELLRGKGASCELHLTGMADPDSSMDTNDDVEAELRRVLALPETQAIVFNVALCDMNGQIGDVKSGKYAERLQTRKVPEGGLVMKLRPTSKVLGLVKELRPDVLAVGFKTTAGQAPEVQVQRAAVMAQQHGLPLVFANDVVTRYNMVIPFLAEPAGEPWPLYAGDNRESALGHLADLVLLGLKHG